MNNASVNEMKLPGERQLAARLDRAFKSAWRSYRRAFKRCQKKLSRGTVHQLRVETRRLLALVDLFDPLPAGDAADRVSRLFKQPFKTSGRLRDAQVMLSDVEQRRGRFPDAKCFKKELLRREKRLSRQLERKLRRTQAETVEEPDGHTAQRVARLREAGEGALSRRGSFVKERGRGVCERSGAPAGHWPGGTARGSSHAHCLQEIPLHGRAVAIC